jgi:hypothetical protein
VINESENTVRGRTSSATAVVTSEGNGLDQASPVMTGQDQRPGTGRPRLDLEATQQSPLLGLLEVLEASTTRTSTTLPQTSVNAEVNVIVTCLCIDSHGLDAEAKQ